jgi:hypothetical protein
MSHHHVPQGRLSCLNTGKALNPKPFNSCVVSINYWMGTEVRQIGGHGCQGAWRGWVEQRWEKWDRDAVNSRGKKQTNVHESAERRKARV